MVRFPKISQDLQQWLADAKILRKVKNLKTLKNLMEAKSYS